jgi:tRNA 2-thiouridine synthesizing protein A
MPASQVMVQRVAPDPPRVVDARGSVCPGPLVDLIAAVKSSGVGDTIVVLARTGSASIDIRAWTAKAGQELVAFHARDGYDELVVRRTR